MKKCFQLLALQTGRLLFFSLFFLLAVNKTAAQDSSQTTGREFVVGSFIQSSPDLEYTQLNNYQQIKDLGLNSVHQIARKELPPDPPYPFQESNLNLLKDFKYIYAANDSGTGGDPTFNAKRPENIDWISYFTQAKYTKWEAEGSPVFNENDGEDIKIKYEMGTTYVDGERTVRRSGMSQSDSGKFMIMGPDYWQYPRYTYTNPGWNWTPINYKANFILNIQDTTGPRVPVCEISVTYSFTDTNGVYYADSTLAIDTIYSDEFEGDYKAFPLFYSYDIFDGTDSEEYYTLPTFLDAYDETQTDGIGLNIGAKTQFKVKWLGTKELFVDYIEVYDIDIWENYFILHFPSLISNITSYDQEFANQNSEFYERLKYYYTQDEPGSIDCYEPLRKIQEIMDSIGVQADLMTHWFPAWNGRRQGDMTFPVYKQLAQPKKLNFWYFPYLVEKDGTWLADEFGLEQFRNVLQLANENDFKDFFVEVQTWGRKRSDGTYERYRSPNCNEVKAQTMLALAHGVKGIYYEPYYSGYSEERGDTTTGIVYVQQGDYFPPRPIYYTIQELAGRLRGTLGKHLINLTYSGDYIRDLKFGTYDYRYPDEIEYIDISVVGLQDSIHFHVSDFDSPGQTQNKYFFIAHAFTGHERSIDITVTDNNSSYINTRLRNIEPIYAFDTTFTDEITIRQIFPAGEGYLYQMAPVVKYGGRLVYDETVADGTTLTDDMTIENGATLTVNGNYDVRANITVKDGGKIVTETNGNLTFRLGKQLIVEGSAEIKGTPSNKLTIDFVEPTSSNGIVVDSSGSLNISYSVIKNAETGILAKVYANYLNAQYVDFIDCSNSAINILGQYAAGNQPTPPPHQIKYSTITNSAYGIQAANLPAIVIQGNVITDTELGIFLSNVASPSVITNTISTSQAVMAGIFLESSDGVVRGNTISGHTNGIHLGNSSPDVGENTLTGNKFHGIYIGAGSLPNMVGRLVLNQNNHLWYPISGYNKIYENGGWDVPGGPADDDGSEIFISNANALMKGGCNSIMDDRLPSPPLATTILLMNGGLSGTQITVNAEWNYWGADTTYPISQRFGSLIVDYDPYYSEPCSLPVGGGSGGGGELITRTSSGEPIDTLYPTDREVGQLTGNEILYSTAEKLFVTGNYESAEEYYDQIINSSESLNNKLAAYSRKYLIGKLMRRTPGYFTNLNSTYLSLAQTANDTLLQNIFSQLATLSLTI